MPTITKHLINRNCTFINQMYPPLVFVVHRTAGHVTNQQLYDYWQQTCISSHFGINWDGDQGDIWQFVELWDGAGANCCPESGCHPFFANRGGNANVYTIPVEVCTPDTGNKNLMQPGQVEALVYLIQTVCYELGIPTDQYSEYWNDYETRHTWIGPSGGIGHHSDVSPHNKQWCVGQPYYANQMDEVIAAVNGSVIPGTQQRSKEQVEQLYVNKSVLLIPPPGNSMLLIGVDFSDANVRIAGHIEGATRWEIKEFNTRPPYDSWHIDIGPDKWPVDKVSVLVTEYNHPQEAAGAATIWPT